MKEQLTPRCLMLKLAGIFFAAYAAYNVFIIIRDGKAFPAEGIFISVLVALLFGTLAGFAWTSEVKNGKFLMIRKAAFIIALIAIFALKLRMSGDVIDYFDFSKDYTILYGVSYFLTLAALLIVFVYYTFIIKNLPYHPKASVILPVFAMMMFLFSLVLEIILFAACKILLEANPLRTAVIRPVFYLGFIFLCIYFLFPLEIKIKDFTAV